MEEERKVRRELFVRRQNRRESWTSIGCSRRNGEVLQNDLLLHEACIKNEPDAVEKILKEPVDVNSRNNYGRAPIHWASSRGSTEVMKMLLDANCDIEAEDKYGMTPLLMAVWHGHVDAAKLLIDSGADVSAVNKNQCTVFMCAAKNNRVNIIDFLLETFEEIKMDEGDFEGRTALHHAAAGGHAETVRKLVEMGANINCSDKKNRTPLHVAAEKGHVEVVEFLLMKEADANAQDEDGFCPLHLSAENKQTGATQRLLEHGADPDRVNEKGLTALHVASHLGCRGIVELLLEHGSNINLRTKVGNSPLHLACKSNESEMVELLVSRGADVNAFNTRLETPIGIAAENDFGQVCKTLLAAGATTMHQKERESKAALQAAARVSLTAMIDTIVKTAKLDCFPPEDDFAVEEKGNVLKRVCKNWRQPAGVRNPIEDGEEKLRSLFRLIANKGLAEGEWKKLALHWSFSQEQIQAVERQYTGDTGHKDRGFKIISIWWNGLGPDINPVKELRESLIAVGNEKAAESLGENLDGEKCRRRLKNKNFGSCSLL